MDTGGVRRQVFTKVYNQFAANEFVHLVDGPKYFLRPAFTAQARSSGLFKLLGTMIVHSINLSRWNWFSFLSPTCFWYLVEGEERALDMATTSDIPADAAHVI